MVRIGGSTPKGEHIKEWDYYTPSGEFRVDSEGSPTLLNCLMYKLCYYRFGQVYTEGGMCLFFVFLKVSYIQNEFMRSSFLPKWQPKITKISALEVY